MPMFSYGPEPCTARLFSLSALGPLTWQPRPLGPLGPTYSSQGPYVPRPPGQTMAVLYDPQSIEIFEEVVLIIANQQ